MAEWRPMDPPKRTPPVITCLITLGLFVLLLVGMWGFWWVLTRIVVPRLPQRMVSHPQMHPGVGQRLHFLGVEPLTGNGMSLSAADIQGRVTLLNFWGTWCPPCRAELPHMDDLLKRFAGQNVFQLVAVSYPPGGQTDDVQSLQEETAMLLKRLNLDMPTYYDPNDRTRLAVDQIIGFEGFPTTVLLDASGKVHAVWVGYRPGVETEMERYIDQLLAQMAARSEP